MKKGTRTLEYFPYSVQISRTMRERLRLEEVPAGQGARGRAPGIIFIRQVANRMNLMPGRAGRPVQAGLLNMYGLLARIFRYLIDTYVEENQPGILDASLSAAGYGFTAPELVATVTSFVELFPGSAIIDGLETPVTFIAGDDASHSRKKAVVRELQLLQLAAKNPALDHFRELFDDAGLAAVSSYRPVVAAVEERLTKEANEMGIGPMGFGGQTTVLDTKITGMHRLPASYFVTVSYMCWAYRRRLRVCVCRKLWWGLY